MPGVVEVCLDEASRNTARRRSLHDPDHADVNVSSGRDCLLGTILLVQIVKQAPTGAKRSAATSSPAGETYRSRPRGAPSSWSLRESRAARTSRWRPCHRSISTPREGSWAWTSHLVGRMSYELLHRRDRSAPSCPLTPSTRAPRSPYGISLRSWRGNLSRFESGRSHCRGHPRCGSRRPTPARLSGVTSTLVT